MTTSHAGSVEPILGVSPFSSCLRRTVPALAGTGENVIIAGEPGTGKRFLAQTLHELGPGARRGAPVEISPETAEDDLRVILFEEHRQTREGMRGHRIPRLPEGGTLFIRNVHEFGFLAQSRIARFLLEQEQSAAAGGRSVRTLFALPVPWAQIARLRPINDTLDACLRRCAGIAIDPLRSRREDIPSFVTFFLCGMTGSRPPDVGAETMKALLDAPYHDNVRELRLLLGEALAVTPDGAPLQLPAMIRDEPAEVRVLLTRILEGKRTNLEKAMHDLEKVLIRRALVRCDWNSARAASLLGLSDLNLRYRLRKFNLTRRIPEKPD